MSTAPQPAKTGAFGERMRREREMRGIKLEEIAESTKIGKRNLEALEQERFDQLPGGIFNKGFVRAYAKYLGLDEEQAVNDFLAASANYDQPSALAPPIPATWVKPPAMPSEASIRRKNRLWALTALLALVAGFALWFYYSRAAQPPSAAPSTRASAEVDLPGAPIAPPAQSRPSSTSNLLVQPPLAVSSTATDSVTHWQSQPPQAAAPNQLTADARVARAPSPALNEPMSQSANGKMPGVTLKVRATQEVWLTLTADGQPLSDLTLLPGERRDFHARRQLVLRTGNAGGLSVSLNGKSLPPLGRDKQVKTVTFTAEGIKPASQQSARQTVVSSQ